MQSRIARHRTGSRSVSRACRLSAIALGAVVTAVIAPSPAVAATLEVADGELRYVGASGHESRINMTQSGTTEVRVQRQPGSGDTDAIVPGTACAATGSPDEYVCTGVSRVRADLGDRIDGIGVYLLTTIPAHLEGGTGDDYLSGGRASDVLRGGPGADYLYAGDGGNDVDGGDGDDEIFSDTGTDVLRGGAGFDSVEFSRTEDPAPDFLVTLDGLANDGVAGENDLVAADIEDVTAGSADYAGNPGTISLTGDAGTNVLRVDYGRAVLAGGGGNDLITGGPHDDVIDARDGAADRISCGDGADSARVDAVDAVGSDCEKVLSEPTTPAPTEDAPPVISLSHPASAAVFTVGRLEQLAAAASDDRAVSKVQFMLGERILCEDSTAPYTCAYTPSSSDVGRQTLLAVAIDSSQQTAVALRDADVRVGSSTAPAVQIPARTLSLTPGARTLDVPVSCRTTAATPCTGVLSVEAWAPARGGSRSANAARRGRRVTIARARFSMESGRDTTVKARISRRGFAPSRLAPERM